MSLIFSGNFETTASKFLENLEEMFPQYYINSDIYNRLKLFATLWCVTRCQHVEEIKYLQVIRELVSSIFLFLGNVDYNDCPCSVLATLYRPGNVS